MAKLKSRENNHHIPTLIFFLIWPVAAVFISFNFRINAFLSPFVFYAIPAALLSILRPNRIRNASIISAVTIPIMIYVDYIAQKTNVWLDSAEPSGIPRIFGVVPIGDLFWAFLHVYLAILFYQYFFEKSYIKKFWDKRSEQAVIVTILTFIIFAFLFFIYPKILEIPYWYIVFGMIGLVPVIILEEIKYPLMFLKLFKVAAYFFYMNFAYEITALNLHWWSFPRNDYIGHVSFLNVTFPMEEFFFWICLFTLSILSYYEYFFNKER